MSITTSGDEGALTVFSDGGCIGNPGPGGWAAVIVRNGHYEEVGGGEPATTNNRMEMTGAIVGLELAQPGQAVRVVTDSRYLIDGATKWLRGWKRKGWLKADGEPVLNRDLWERIDALNASRKVTWEHVRGHAGHPENERCDVIANGFARGAPPVLKSGDGAWIFSAAREVASKVKKSVKSGQKKSEKAPPVEGDVKYAKPLYLSVIGGDVKEHETWADCEARIKGVKGSRCRKVASRGEHVAALVAWKDLA